MRRERVRRWVDGELDATREAKLLADAERDPKLAILIEDARAVSDALGALEPPEIPDDLVDRAVLRAVRLRAKEEAAPAWKRWLRRPWIVRIRVVTLAVALGAAVLAGWSLRTTPDLVPLEAASHPGVFEPALTAVRFVLPAEGARTVTVAGDFNGWNTESLFLEDPEGDGTFVGTLRLEPGSYAYMFVIDGDRWVTDPYAVNHRDDGFGNQNAVLRID